MKPIRNIFASLFLLGGFIAFDNLLPAQEAISSISATNDASGLSDLEVEEKAIEMTTPTPVASLPVSGTYWSAQHAPGTKSEWPPLPGNVTGNPAWSLGDGTFLLDDLNVDYNALSAGSSPGGGSRSMALSGPPGFGDGGPGGVSPDFGSPSVPDYGTNLWLAITNLAGNMAALLLSNTVADIKYEIQGAADLTDTNWISEGFVYGSELTNWTPANVAATNYPNLFLRVRSWQDSDGSGLPDWWQLQYFGTTGVDPNGDPMGDGWSNIQKFQNGMNPNVFYTPPMPQNLTLHVDGTGTNVTLSWQSCGGNVSQYKVEKSGDWETDTTNYVWASQTSITINLDLDYFGTEFDTPDFQVTALYTNGTASATATVNLSSSFALSGQFVHTAQGQYELITGNLPPDATTIRLFWETDYDFYTNAYYDVPVSNIVNGIFILPSSVMAGYPTNYTTLVQILYQSGQLDWEGDYGNGYADAVYADTANTNGWQTLINNSSRTVKDNLIFLLRSATVNHSFSYESGYASPYGYYGETFNRSETGAAYEYSNYRYYNPYEDGLEFENFRPITENYLWRNYADFNNIFPAGAYYDYGDGTRTFYEPEYVIQDTNLPPNAIPSSLLNNDTDSYYYYRYPADPAYEPLAYPEIGLQISGTNVFLPTGVKNLYGLAITSVTGDYGFELDAGGAALPLDEFSIASGWYVQTAFPSLETVDYYFASQTPHDVFGAAPAPPAPGTSDFSPTDTSPLLITGIGQTFTVMGWAKEAIANGYSGKYAYLEQYFDRAWQMDTNGVATTNSAGTLSSYGDFFATEPGPAALVTMPDLDTGERGTATVYAVSLQLDANHDGTMDLSFNGGDATSASSPMTFWSDQNFDRWTYDSNDSTNYMDDVQAGNNSDPAQNLDPNDPDCNYTVDGNRVIPDTRDLQDFTRLWVAGITTNLLAALPAGSTVTLNWGDVGSPNSGNPTIDIFQATDADGGVEYLTNETSAANQIDPAQSSYIGRLAPGGSIQLNASQFANNWAGNCFIWCGVSNGTGGLNLTIQDGSGNVLAQSTAYIQIKDIKQMYERWTVGDELSKSPLTNAIPATEGLLPFASAFRYTPPQDTNTPYILFVHGWNLQYWEKDRFAESAFKRLYWQGYQGRFGEFRWPTGYGFSGLWQIIATNLDEKDNYDSSEYNAWRSGQGLLNKLEDLNAQYPGHVYMLAHSMGNVVANEALRLAGTNEVVNTYVASQGAVTAHTYDANVPDYSFVYFAYGVPLSLSPDTPNIYGDWFADNGYAAGAIVNFYNTNDYALSRSVWQLDQLLKPDHSVLEGADRWTYGYSGSVSDPSPWNNFYKSDTNSTTVDFNIVTSLNNRYEVMAYDAQPYTTALGATPGVLNVTRSVDLMGLWLSDPSGKNYTEHFWHSAEFEGDYPPEQNYWSELLGSDAFNLK